MVAYQHFIDFYDASTFPFFYHLRIHATLKILLYFLFIPHFRLLSPQIAPQPIHLQIRGCEAVIQLTQIQLYQSLAVRGYHDPSACVLVFFRSFTHLFIIALAVKDKKE